MDFLNDRVGVEVGFGYPPFIGIDLLKLQVASYSGLDKIEVGIYVMTTQAFSEKDEERLWPELARFSAFALESTLA